jgi:ribosomal protein L19E
MLATTLPTQTEREHVEGELRHAETELRRWRRSAEDAEGRREGQRRAAAAQAAWYAQQVDRYRTRLAQLRRDGR